MKLFLFLLFMLTTGFAQSQQEITEAEMIAIIRSSSKTPIRRDTLYRALKTYNSEESVGTADPLVPRSGTNPLCFLTQ